MHAIYENHYLTDNDVANFARQSFGRLADDFTEEQNNRLIRFLARGTDAKVYDQLVEDVAGLGKSITVAEAKELLRNWRNTPEHWVPFGHPSITLRMNAPVPIRTQCFKHKIGFVESEESRRYIKTTPTIYYPEFFRPSAENVKQGSSDEPHLLNNDLMRTYIDLTGTAIKLYEEFLAQGVCPEQARFLLPQGAEVNWTWTGSLYAYANFYNQRIDTHAQKEVQDLAKQIGDIIEPLFPVSWAALTRAEY